jgi:hypothetical protein
MRAPLIKSMITGELRGTILFRVIEYSPDTNYPAFWATLHYKDSLAQGSGDTQLQALCRAKNLLKSIIKEKEYKKLRFDEIKLPDRPSHNK